MIKHIVCFKLKDNSLEECEKAANILKSMEGNVPLLRGGGREAGGPRASRQAGSPVPGHPGRLRLAGFEYYVPLGAASISKKNHPSKGEAS